MFAQTKCFNGSMNKTCTKCKEAKGLVDFQKRKDGKYGRDSICKSCKSEITQRRYYRNKERYLAYRRKGYRKKHPVIKEKDCEYCGKTYSRSTYRATAKSRFCTRSCAEKKRRRTKRFKMWEKEYYSRTEVVILNRLRSRLHQAVKHHGARKNKTTLQLTGCTLNKLIAHLEGQFQQGMNWDNYGDWHIDHIIPCAAFNLKDEEERIKCFHYTNLQPLWGTENRKKNTKSPAATTERGD